ncbi:MAG: crossover junction endodeoxyribonuclease RuvC [Coriobacteriia bacterium]|nr:crossover junction endodeoxyribonuclease RuvC [Coriobacteriia bacterium]
MDQGTVALRILGIDPGLANTGWGIVESAHGANRALAYGHISTAADLSRPERLALIHQGIVEVITRYRPREAAIEAVFFSTNAKSALSIGEVRGVVMLAAAVQQIPVDEYSATQIKQTIVGVGRADKSQVQFMVQAILKLDHRPQPDHSSDALAVALCHAQMRKAI